MRRRQDTRPTRGVVENLIERRAIKLARQAGHVFRPDELERLARDAGLSVDELRAKL